MSKKNAAKTRQKTKQKLSEQQRITIITWALQYCDAIARLTGHPPHEVARTMIACIIVSNESRHLASIMTDKIPNEILNEFLPLTRDQVHTVAVTVDLMTDLVGLFAPGVDAELRDLLAYSLERQFEPRPKQRKHKRSKRKSA